MVGLDNQRKKQKEYVPYKNFTMSLTRRAQMIVSTNINQIC